MKSINYPMNQFSMFDNEAGMQPLDVVEPILTYAQFVVQLPGRKIETPDLSFEEYAITQGYSVSDIMNEHDFAKIIVGLYAETTTHGRGKLKQPIKRMNLTNILSDKYQEAINSKQIGKQVQIVPFKNTESDEAYKRVRYRRYLRQLQQKGVSIPPDFWPPQVV